MDRKEELWKVLPQKVREPVRKAVKDFSQLQELRFRVNCPLLIYWAGREYFLTESVLKETREPIENACVITKEEIDEMVEYISGYSIYAFLEEVKQGFLTLPGGHRVGLTGKTVMDKEQVKTIQFISGLNLRVSHQVEHCADSVMPYLYIEREPCHTLLISPPGCGKTTLLRDCIRQFSNGTAYGKGVSVTVIDERSEIAACYQGIPQNQIGLRTDILDCCKKITGMELAIRSMSPKILAIDELGGLEDVKAMEQVMHCGCHILATIHGENLDEVCSKPHFQKAVKERWFQRFVVLKKGTVGKVEGIYDKYGKRVV